MSTTERVRALVTYVEQGRACDALREFYADDAPARTIPCVPMVGPLGPDLDERSVVTVHEHRAAGLVVSGDRAAINWVFDYTDRSGARHRLDEIALQTWENGRVVRERCISYPALFAN